MTATETADTLFYDGTCGLCHGAVRFVLARDRAGAFRFAPLAGETFRRLLPESDRQDLPDSMVLLTRRGEVLSRSAAVLYISRRLGGPWRWLAAVASVAPRPLLDWLYERVAAVRYRLFRRPTEACPIVPNELRGRFQD